MRSVPAEVAERSRLHQRHRGAPEKAHQRQHQEHAPETCGREHAEIAHRAQGCGELHNLLPPAGMVGQPAPDVGRDHAHHRLYRHQDGDLDCAELDGLQVQAPVGREHPDEGVIEEIEPGDAPVVVLGGGHGMAASGRRALSHAAKIILHPLLKWETQPPLPTSQNLESSMEQNDTNPPEPQPAAASPAEVMPSLEEMLKEAERKAQEHYDAWRYAKAESENIRRRAMEDVSKAHKFAVERL